LRTALDIALRYYEEHGCIAFWNPRDITLENLRTDTPDAEALVIEPGTISSCEVHEGQYLVKDRKLAQYESYPGHEGVDKVFAALKRTRPELMADTAIRRCVSMGWVMMEATDGEGGFWEGLYFKWYKPPPEDR
jgi:hypothetical protein